MPRPVKWSRDLHSIRDRATGSRTETWSRQDVEQLFSVGRASAQTLLRAIGGVATIAGAHFVDRAAVVGFLDAMILAPSVEAALQQRLAAADPPPRRTRLRTSLPADLRQAMLEGSAGASWRFLHSVTQVGKRLEATGTLGVVVPGPQSDSGVLGTVHRAPGIAGTVATGVASRSHYLWVGGGYTWFPETDQTKRPDTISWSTVYGYRPARLRRGYDQWDYRGLLEFTGEHTSAVRVSGADLPNSSTTSLWLGPSVLAIFKNVAI